MLGQGFLFARPMSAADFATTVLDRTPAELSAEIAAPPPQDLVS